MILFFNDRVALIEYYENRGILVDADALVLILGQQKIGTYMTTRNMSELKKKGYLDEWDFARRCTAHTGEREQNARQKA